MGKNLDYLPFEFEGQKSPAPTLDALEQALQNHESLWIRAAVVYDRFTEAIYALIESYLQSNDTIKLDRAFQWTIATAQRKACPLICDALCEGKWQEDIEMEYRAIQCVFTLCSAQNIYFKRVFDYGFIRATAQQNLKISKLIYQALPLQNPIIPLKPILMLILKEDPSWGIDLGQRLALYYLDDCLEIVEFLSSLPKENKKPLALSLEKHLKRILAIKKWVYCRSLLNA
jgi:hypothetical protein